MKKSTVAALVLLGLLAALIVGAQAYGIRFQDVLDTVGLEPEHSATRFVLVLPRFDGDEAVSDELVSTLRSVPGVALVEWLPDHEGEVAVAVTCDDLGWSFGNEVLDDVKAAIPERYGAWMQSAQHTQEGWRFRRD